MKADEAVRLLKGCFRDDEPVPYGAYVVDEDDVAERLYKVTPWLENLVKAVEWVAEDMAYKAPEQTTEMVPAWFKKLQEALGEEG